MARTAPLPLPLPSLGAPALEALGQIYARLDQKLKSLEANCDACGRCCRLVEHDHELWLTDVEMVYLLVAEGFKPISSQGVCPYLVDDLCSARKGRALGCRVYHCGMDTVVLQKISDTFLREILEVARGIGLEPTYGELLATLEEMKRFRTTAGS